MDKKRRTIDGLTAREVGAPRRNLGFSEGKRAQEMRALGVTGEKIVVTNSNRRQKVEVRRGDPVVARRRLAADEEVAKTEGDPKMASFLREVKDEDPTDLVGGRDMKPPREKREGQGRHILKWVILVPIIAVLAVMGMMILAVELGWWDVQGALMGESWGAPTVVAAVLDAGWNLGELVILRWVFLALIIGVIGLAIWNGKKVFGVKKWKVMLAGALIAVVGLLGIAIWKGADMLGDINDALHNMSGGRVSVGGIQAADPTIPLKQDARGRTNVLVYGTSGHDMDDSDHDGFQLADTIMVVSLDQEAGDIKSLSIPRDLVSKHPCTKTAKMNETYWCTYQGYLRDERYAAAQNDPEALAALRWEYEEKAGASFAETIGEITGLEIHYWAHINWGALIAVVDAIGGIDVAIEYEGNEDSYTGDLPVIWTTDTRGIQDRNWDWACRNTCYFVKYANGERPHLDGVHAIALARARGEAQPAYGTNGNWSRERNQQAILEAIALKAKQTNFVANMDSAMDIIQALGDNLRMSFDSEGVRRGIDLAGKMNVAGMQTIDLESVFTTGMLPVPGVNGLMCAGATVPGCLSYVLPKAGSYNYTTIADYIAKKLVSDPVVEEGAIIDVLNGTEQTGLAGKTAQAMRDDGYTIGVVGNAAEGTEWPETVIYRVGETVAAVTEQKLIERFGVEAIHTEGLPEGMESTADYVVVLGENYL